MSEHNVTSEEEAVNSTVVSRSSVPELQRGMSDTSAVCETEADDFFVREPQLDEDLVKAQHNCPLNALNHGLRPGVAVNSVDGKFISKKYGTNEDQTGFLDSAEAYQTIERKPSLDISESRSNRQTHINTDKMEEEISPVSDNAAIDSDEPSDQTASRRRMLTACGCFKKIIFPVVGMILYSWDIFTDMKMAISYKESGDLDLFLYTVLALLCPALYIMKMDIGFLLKDYRYSKKARQPTHSGDATVKDDLFENETSEGTNIIRHVIWQRIPKGFKVVFRIVFTVITLGAGAMLCITLQCTYYFVKSVLSKSPTHHTFYKKRARHLQRECLMMSFSEAFLESAPQLALQLYITYALDRNFTPLRVQNIVTSALCITWNYSAFYRSNRANINNTEDVKLIPFLIYLVSVACCIVPRFISFVLFAVYFETAGQVTVLGIFGIHVVYGFLVITIKVESGLKGTTEHPVNRWLDYAFFAYVMFFLFVNLEYHQLSQSNGEVTTIRRNWFEEKKTKTRMLLLYAVIHLENLILATILISFRLDLMADGFFVFIVVLIGAFGQLICLSSYYYCFHRNRPGKCVGCLKSSYCPCPCLNNLF